jgi:hypothetical protein
LLEVFHRLVEMLKAKLPRLGEKLAVDSKAIRSWGRPVRDEDKRQQTDRRRDTDADRAFYGALGCWGTKTYKGVREDGSQWEKVKKWFGYKLHLMVDSEYELPLAFDVASASSSDMDNLMPLVEQLAVNHPHLAEAADELSADKGYDSTANNRGLCGTWFAMVPRFVRYLVRNGTAVCAVPGSQWYRGLCGTWFAMVLAAL